MKKFLFVICIFLGFFISNQIIIKPGIMPDSFLYSIDLMYEKYSIKLKKTEEEKIILLTKLAQERIDEIHYVNDISKVQNLYKSYGKNLEAAYIFYSKLRVEEKISFTKLNALNQLLVSTEAKAKEVHYKIHKDTLKEVHNRVKASKLYVYTPLQDFSYEDTLTLQALSDISKKPIDEILNIDESTIDDKNNKKLNIEVIIKNLDISEKQLKDKLSEYSQVIELEIQEQIDILRLAAEEKKNEIINDIKEQIKQKINEKIDNL